jgi:molybdate transport system permease protein
MFDDANAIWLTLQLAIISSLCLLVFALPLAWFLARWRHPLKPIVQSIIALPLVLPPTVLGFYLLIAFAPDSFIGSSWQAITGERLAFSFSALILGSMLYSLPFAVQPLYAGFSQFNRDYLAVGASLNLPPLQRFLHIVLPMHWPHIFIALGLCFAHTIGEFGVVLMIGGNIPDQTRVVSIALFDHVESLQYGKAHQLSAVLIVFSLAMLTLMYWVQRKKSQ